MRDVVLEQQPIWYIEECEPILRGYGFPHGEIQALAAVLWDVVLGLQKGWLRVRPDYQGRDHRRYPFSCYTFGDSVVEGLFSASPDIVYLEHIAFTFDEPAKTDRSIARLLASAVKMAA